MTDLSASQGKARVLVIDDEEEIAELFRDVLTIAGFAVTAASRPAEIIALIDQSLACFDIVVLDLSMPGFDGVEVMRRLAARGCEARLVLVSGFDRKVLDGARELATRYGLSVGGCLEKPIRSVALVDMLRRLPQTGQREAAPALALAPEDLARGLAAGELVVHYQPMVTLADGQWVGIEALARWQHPEQGLIGPQHFIPLAEASGLSSALTLTVLESVVADLRHVNGSLGFHGAVSVNLSPSALTDLRLPELIVERLQRHGDLGCRIRFEITETSVPANQTMALDILTRLRLAGYALSIDDFGTGHSTMDNLRRLPIQELKIDRGFVQEAESDSRARVIVESSAALARDLGLTVVAEGVETMAAWRWLKSIGVDIAQGYLIARPMPIVQLAGWHAAWTATDRASAG